MTEHPLPNRLHTTVRQLHQADPQAREFFELKRQYDPREAFQNQFCVKYGRPAVGDPE